MSAPQITRQLEDLDPATSAVHAKATARIEPIDPSRTGGEARELLDELVGHGGTPGPLVLAMATAPALLQLLTGAFNLVAGIHSTPTARSAV